MLWGDSMATVGLSLIVKNEEHTLPRLLDSVKPLVNQIVVVDTGSTDQTKEVAKSYGAEIYDFEWIDDFSAARNESLKHVTQDYTLWLDADDIITPENVAKIKEILANPSHDQYLFTYNYAHDENNNPITSFLRERLFKTSLNLRWVGPIHEHLPIIQDHKVRGDIFISHYKTKENSANTYSRNVRLLKKALETDPDNPRHNFYLGKEQFDGGEHDEAEQTLLRFLNLEGHKWVADVADAYNKLSKIALDKGNMQNAHRFIDFAISQFPDKSEYHNHKAYLYLKNGQNEEAILEYRKSLEGKNDLWTFTSVDSQRYIPAIQLCCIYYNMGEYRKAQQYLNIAKEVRPNDKNVLHNQKILTEKIQNTYELVLIGKTEQTEILESLTYVFRQNQLKVAYCNFDDPIPPAKHYLVTCNEANKTLKQTNKIFYYLDEPPSSDIDCPIVTSERSKFGRIFDLGPIFIPYPINKNKDPINKTNDLALKANFPRIDGFFKVEPTFITTIEQKIEFYKSTKFCVLNTSKDDCLFDLHLMVSLGTTPIVNDGLHLNLITHGLNGYLLNPKKYGPLIKEIDFKSIADNPLLYDSLTPSAFIQEINRISGIKTKFSKLPKFCYVSEAPLNSGAGEIRLTQLNKLLTRFGQEIEIFKPDQVPTGYNAYILFNNYNINLIKKLKNYGKVYLEFTEDLVHIAPQLKRIYAMVDGVIVCTEKLADSVRKYNSNVFIVHDGFYELIDYDIRTSPIKKLGWVGFSSNKHLYREKFDRLRSLGYELIYFENDPSNSQNSFKFKDLTYGQMRDMVDAFILPTSNEQPSKSCYKLRSLFNLGLPVFYEKRHSFSLLNPETQPVDFLTLENLEPSPKKQYLDKIGLKFNLWETLDEWLEFWLYKPAKINVQCGDIKIPGFVNIDHRQNSKPDVLTEFLNYKPCDRVDFIYFNHTFDSYNESEILAQLKHALKILNPAGRIDLLVTNFKELAKRYAKGEIGIDTIPKWLGTTLWDKQKLESLLKKIPQVTYEPINIRTYPYVVVSDINNPQPDPYHIGYRLKPCMLKSEAEIDVIIPTIRSNEKLLMECISSLTTNTDRKFNITIVDSSGCDEELDLSVSKYLKTNRSLSFAEAVNYGVGNTSAETICILNDDTIVTRGWGSLFDKLDQFDIVGSYSNADYNWLHKDEIIVDGQTVDNTLNIDTLPIESLKNYKHTPTKSAYERDWIAFFATAMKRETYRKVGSLNEFYLNGGEDFDYCKRARELGMKVGYIPESLVFHFGKISRGNDLSKVDSINAGVKARVDSNKGKSICFYAGPAWEKWTPINVYTTGIGGSETMLVHTAAWFKKLGYDVVVYNDCGDQAGVYDGVNYKPYQQFTRDLQEQEFDIFISSRVGYIFKEPIRAKEYYCWVHDIWLANQSNAYIGQDKVNKYLVLSDWHREFFKGHHRVPDNQVHKTFNAISEYRFLSEKPPVGNRLIYSSSPDRGLDVLLKVFPKIKQRVPDLELHIFYGFENWEKSAQAKGDQNSLNYMEQLKSFMNQPGVYYHGRIDQSKLAQEFLKSKLWAYPTNFTETSCITAMEAMATGTPIVCTDLAGLSTTCEGVANFVYEGRYQFGQNQSEEYQQEFINKVVSMLQNEKLWSYYQKLGYEKVKTYTFRNLVENWESLFKGN